MNFNRRQMLAALAGLPLLPSLARAQTQISTSHGKPNVLLIMADDAGREVFDFTGGTYQPTPHLNALAASAVNFDTCYATPLCATSRAELLTGLYPFENGWINNPRTHDGCRILSNELRTIGHVFQDAGYKTALSGKWHLSRHDADSDRITRAGFDDWLASAWMLAETDEEYNAYWQPGVLRRGGLIEVRESAFGPNLFAGFLMDFMAQAARDDQPFFAYYPMILPHSPFCETPAEVPDFSTLMDESAYYEASEQSDCVDNPRTEAALFPQLITYMDQLIGQIMAFLRTTGLAENTVVIFTTDNGTKRTVDASYHGQPVSGGKGTFFDLGMNVPLLVQAPGLAPARSREPFDFVELHHRLATLAESGTISGLTSGTPSDYAMSALDDSWVITDGTWKLTSLSAGSYSNMRHRNRRRTNPFAAPISRTSLCHVASDPLERHPINPLTAMANTDTRDAWRRLKAEAQRRLTANPHLPPSAHYPKGRDDCWDEGQSS